MLSTAIAGPAALLLAVGGGATAVASPNLDPLINPDQTGNVTIHALEQDVNLGTLADGRRQADLDSRPGMPGLTFSAQQIASVTVADSTHSLDLTTNIGWANATLLEFDSRGGAWRFDGEEADVVLVSDSLHTSTTGPADGAYSPAMMKDMPIGLYLFEETDSPANVTRAKPWVMTVPLTHPTELNSWMYDIHVYPKNTTTAITKTVEDFEATVLGDVVVWTITAGFPLVANPYPDPQTPISLNVWEPSSVPDKFFPPEQYVIKDELDPRLSPRQSTVKAELLGGADAEFDPDDYTITWEEGESGKTLIFALTDIGRAKTAEIASLSDSPSDVKIQLTIETEVHSFDRGAYNGTVGDGLISNQARLYLDQDAIDEERPIESEEPITKWGDILIKKVNAAAPDYKLRNAEFSVFRTREDAEALTNPLSINGNITFKTNWDGTALLSGLRYSGWTMNDTVKKGEPGWKSYWLVETRAPEGFELLAEPIEVEVDSASQTIEYATVIANEPSNARFELPLSGAGGTWLFTAGGLLLAGGGAALAMRKKSSKESIEL